MNESEKTLLLSLVRGVENLVIERAALAKVAETHRIPPHVKDAAVASLKNDPVILATIRPRFQPLYDQIERAPDLSKVKCSPKFGQVSKV